MIYSDYEEISDEEPPSNEFNHVPEPPILPSSQPPIVQNVEPQNVDVEMSQGSSRYQSALGRHMDPVRLARYQRVFSRYVHPIRFARVVQPESEDSDFEEQHPGPNTRGQSARTNEVSVQRNNQFQLHDVEQNFDRSIRQQNDPDLLPMVPDEYDDQEIELGEQHNDILPHNYQIQQNDVQEVTESLDSEFPPSDVKRDEMEDNDHIERENEDKLNETIGDDGQTCSICLDAWGNSGDHRLVALKCGHLFGHQCILRWLMLSQLVKERCCPTCKAKAAIKDIRCIYARKLIAADTSVISSLQTELEASNAEKNHLSLELQKVMMNQNQYISQIERMRQTILELRSQAVQGPDQKNLKHKSWRFSLEKNLEVTKYNGCRVMTYNCRKYELYVSQQSQNPVFPGFGIRKINCINYALGQFVFLHPKQIRDLSYSFETDLLLSASFDKTVKSYSARDNHITSTFECEMPAWCCTWDLQRASSFYVGGPNGAVLHFDVRNTERYVEKLTIPGDLYAPIVSIAVTPAGIIACRLDSCYIFGRYSPNNKPQILPIEGPFLGVNYDRNSEHVLISGRPNQQINVSRHLVCNVTFASEEFKCDVVHQFAGSGKQSLMSRACQMKTGEDIYVAAHSESEGAVCLWNVNTGERLPQSLQAQDPVLDLCAVYYNGNTFLASLSAGRTRFYKTIYG